MPDIPSTENSELDQLKYRLKVRDAADRVLARALAMHHTSELQEVINEAGKQLRSLDLDITGGVFISINEEVGPDLYVWGYGGTADYVQRVRVPYFDRPIYHGLVNHIKNGSGLYTESFSHAEKIEFFELLFRHPPYNQTSRAHQENVLAREGGYARSCYTSEYTSIFIINHHGRKFSASDHEVLVRFAEVFEQGYRRFLDLQKAEAQTREAQIEAALERIRGRALGMRSSDELSDVLSVMFRQLDVLGIQPVYGCLDIFDLENDTFTHVITGKAGYRHPVRQVIGLDAMDIWKESVEAWKKGDPEIVQQLHYPPDRTGEVWEVFNALFDSLPEEARFDRSDFPDGMFSVSGHHKHGYMGYMHHRAPTEEEVRIISRFSKEFDRLYQRFLELKKAEARAREAQIEAALERTRTQSMLMQHSEELDTTARVFHEQLLSLGIESEFSYVWLPDIEQGKHMFWATFEATGEHGPSLKSKSVIYDLDRTEPYTAACFAAWESDEPVHVIPIPPEEVAPFFDTWSELLKGADKLTAENFPGGLYYAEAYMKYGCFGINIRRKLSRSEEQILQRFTVEFERTYTRFLDLQKAEAQTREARIETALEKVRARTIGMQKSSELSETASLMFKQVEQLGLNPWSCGFNIWDHELNKITQWVSSGDGRILPPFQTPSDEDVFLRFSKASKNSEDLYVEEIGGHELIAHYDYMRSIPGLREIMNAMDAEGIALPTFQVFHLAFFSHGYLMFITYEPAPEFHDIFKRFANVFEQTYTRFLDLKQAEEQELRIREEKERLENTLEKLRATQSQLIHAEKMASLGELTAGIAHEIQNPLNFVNNFSEVSNELLEELQEELEADSHTDAKEILEDLVQNLQKINHHGHRASSIVKSMLDHSRTGSGERVETNINQLADEYLRLAYHGMRARDKTFDVAFETDLDPALPPMHVVPQDIGRVLLNLVNNAFQAVSEKAVTPDPAYNPLVKVTTRIEKDDNGEVHVQIKVSDNGPGIPEKIRDKIFQPFFTTKPTGQGTGLGLSLSYDIVQAHGGMLSVTPNDQAGTTFLLDLPTGMNQ